MAEEWIPLNSAEYDNDTAWYTAAASGIASGILKVPEGVFSLAAELIDLGADTNTAASVEQFFDKLNPFEEIAEERAIGRLTEALVQVGVPGAIGFKLANKAARNLTAKALRAKRANNYANLKSKNLMSAMGKVKDFNRKAKYGRFAAGIMGGAAGEAFVADTEKIGTFGDMFDGPTSLDREEKSDDREEAARKLMNRIKFGSESLLITPFVYGAGKSAKLLANKGRDLAYSNSQFARWLDKYVRAPFSPRGGLTQELFESETLKEALRGRDINRAREIVDNITREVDGIFPETQIMFDKSVRTEKDKFLKGLNEILFEGDIRAPIDSTKLDDLLDLMKKSNVKDETRQVIVGGLNNARGEFNKLINILDNNATGDKLSKGVKELQGLFKDRITGWVGGTYKIFETPKRGLFKFFQRYTPTDEAYTAAVRFFRQQIAKENGDTAFDMGSNKYTQEARAQVESILNTVGKTKKPKELGFNEYINKTMEGRPGASFIKETIKNTNAPPKEIRELLGEIQDPRYSIFNAMTNLSSVARTAAYLSDVAAKNDEVQAAGGRGFFWGSKEAGEKALDSMRTGIELVPMKDITKELPGAGKIVDPLSTKWTTKEIAEAIKNANNLAGGLQGFVRGEGKEGAEQAVSWFYRNLLLFPKAISQLSKTVLSAPTHLRNFISAFGFAGANGNLFEPKFYTSAFKDGLNISGLTKLDPSTQAPEFKKLYRELLELGVVNQQVQIGDLKNLLRDVRFGEQASNIDTVLSPMMSKLKKIPMWAQGKYVAEDDTFKIASFFVEMHKLKRGYDKAGIFVTNDTLKKEAADIVKNTVPNYSFVGSAVRTARLLPIGNFMSFPSEMIRTTTNIAELGLKQMRHSRPTRGSSVAPIVYDIEAGAFVKNDNPFYGDGIKRLVGLTTFVTGAPVALTEGAKALYDVSQDELDALRRFVPEWSKNSTLIPVRDEETGDLRYIDFSHSNAYDVIARPMRTLLNNIQDGAANEEQLLKSFVDGVNEATAEIVNPFVSESIWTEAMADLTVRGGVTKDGRRLYTDQTPAGDKAAIRMMHAMNALAPSYKQFLRLYQAGTQTPTRTGDLLDVGPEIAGFMGLRPIKVNPERAMDFKIQNYQTGIRDARREFTGGAFGLLKGGRVTVNDIINRFAKSNASRFNVQQTMFNDLQAAETLGVDISTLRNQFQDRQLTNKTFNDLKNGRFEPYFPSGDVADKFREIANNLGEDNPFIEAAPILRDMASEMKQLSLDEPFSIDMDDFLIEDIVTPPLPESVTSAMPNNKTITQGQNILNQGMNAQANLTQNGLTEIENALLSEEEKQMRLRQRGIIS
tara:strand:- start:9810 stop:13787 length:3978 start_codon:yes stop_codon:yes gene_type:complete